MAVEKGCCCWEMLSWVLRELWMGCGGCASRIAQTMGKHVPIATCSYADWVQATAGSRASRYQGPPMVGFTFKGLGATWNLGTGHLNASTSQIDIINVGFRMLAEPYQSLSSNAR